MEFDAVILAGGRSSRLGGVPKSLLVADGVSLIHRAVAAASGAQRIAVVGPEIPGLPEGVLTCREDPPFAGPAAALAAGLSALAGTRTADPGQAPPLTLVLACDMPRAEAAVEALRRALAGMDAAARATEAAATEEAKGGPSGPVGAVAVSADGRRQHLLGFYGTAALQRSAANAARHGQLVNASVTSLLASLEVREVRVPSGSTDDVDTWDDATALGVTGRPDPAS